MQNLNIQDSNNSQNINAETLTNEISQDSITAFISTCQVLNDVLTQMNIDMSNIDTTNEEAFNSSIDQLTSALTTMVDESDASPEHKNMFIELLAKLQEVQAGQTQVTALQGQMGSLQGIASTRARASDYKQDVQDMNKSEHHKWWQKALHVTTKYVVPAVMAAVGAATGDPALIMGALVMVALADTPLVKGVAEGVTAGLEQLGVPDKVAKGLGLATALVLVTVATFVTCGAVGVDAAAEEGGTLAADAAEAVEEKASSVADNLKAIIEKVKLKPKNALTLMAASMTLSQESTDIATGLVSFVPEGDTKVRKRLDAAIQGLIDVVAILGSTAGMVSLASAGGSASSFLADASASLSELFEGAGSAGEFLQSASSTAIEGLSNASDVIARNARVIMALTQMITGGLSVGSGVTQFETSKLIAEMGELQADMALIDATQKMNQNLLSQEMDDFKSFLNQITADEQFVEEASHEPEDAVANILAH